MNKVCVKYIQTCITFFHIFPRFSRDFRRDRDPTKESIGSKTWRIDVAFYSVFISFLYLDKLVQIYELSKSSMI